MIFCIIDCALLATVLHFPVIFFMFFIDPIQFYHHVIMSVTRIGVIHRDHLVWNKSHMIHETPLLDRPDAAKTIHFMWVTLLS